MAKKITYNLEARDALKRGADALADAVKITLGPKGRNVIIDKKFGAPQISKDGVTVAKEKPQKGKVVAAGKGTKDEPITVKVGDTVLYGKYAGTEIALNGGEYIIMRESDIFAVI